MESKSWRSCWKHHCNSTILWKQENNWPKRSTDRAFSRCAKKDWISAEVYMRCRNTKSPSGEKNQLVKTQKEKRRKSNERKSFRKELLKQEGGLMSITLLQYLRPHATSNKVEGRIVWVTIRIMEGLKFLMPFIKSLPNETIQKWGRFLKFRPCNKTEKAGWIKQGIYGTERTAGGQQNSIGSPRSQTAPRRVPKRREGLVKDTCRNMWKIVAGSRNERLNFVKFGRRVTR